MTLAGAALVWALLRLVRIRDEVPLLMWAGALIAVAAEPILDVLCHIWYAPDLPATIVTGWGIKVPLLVGLAWAFFVGMTGYLAYRLMDKGLTAPGTFKLMGGYMLLDAALEYPALTGGAWQYYGGQPFRLFGFPLWMTWINATGMILGGFLVWILAPRLSGAWRLVILLAPGAGYLTAWTVLGWPNYLALEWNPPVAVRVAMSSFSLVFCLLVIRGIAACIAPRGSGEESLRRAVTQPDAACAASTSRSMSIGGTRCAQRSAGVGWSLAQIRLESNPRQTDCKRRDPTFRTGERRCTSTRGTRIRALESGSTRAVVPSNSTSGGRRRWCCCLMTSF